MKHLGMLVEKVDLTAKIQDRPRLVVITVHADDKPADRTLP